MSTLVTTALRHNASASNNMVLDSNGRVGIGTATPSFQFQVAGQAAVNQIVFPAAGTNYITAAGASSAIVFQTVGLDRALLDSSGNFGFNSGFGSVATAFGCRAWVNFNGTGTVAIRGSGNISSITDHGVGDYTVNFTSAMPDVNYSVQGLAGDGTGVVPRVWQNLTRSATATGSVAIGTVNFQSSFADIPHVFVAVFR